MEALSLVYQFKKTLIDWLNPIEVELDQLNSNFATFLKETMVCAQEDISIEMKIGPMETKHSDVTIKPLLNILAHRHSYTKVSKKR